VPDGARRGPQKRSGFEKFKRRPRAPKKKKKGKKKSPGLPPRKPYHWTERKDRNQQKGVEV